MKLPLKKRMSQGTLLHPRPTPTLTRQTWQHVRACHATLLPPHTSNMATCMRVPGNVITPSPHPNPPHVKHGNMYARATQRYYPPTRPTWQHVCVCQGTLLPPHPTPTLHTSNMATCMRVPKERITPPPHPKPPKEKNISKKGKKCGSWCQDAQS